LYRVINIQFHQVVSLSASFRFKTFYFALVAPVHATCPLHAILAIAAINSCLLMASYVMAKRFLRVYAGGHNQRRKKYFSQHSTQNV